MTVTFFYHKNEWRLEIVGRIISCEFVIYVFVGPTKRNVPVLYYYTKDNR